MTSPMVATHSPKIAVKLKPADPEWKVFNVLQTTAGQTGALDVGYFPGVEAAIKSQSKVLILLGADAGKIRREDLSQNCYIVYQGHIAIMVPPSLMPSSRELRTLRSRQLMSTLRDEHNRS